LLPPELSEAELRKVIVQARRGDSFLYSPRLFEKLARHGVSIQDLLYVSDHWEVLRSTRLVQGEWRYRLEGPNLDDKWMAVVLSVKETASVIAITGFRFARGKKTR
jgi:uncharacterized DUF497 family protein